MQDIPVSVFFQFFMYLLMPFLGGYFLKRLKISPIIGYIIGGILLGNIFPVITQNQIISNFASFGIMLLLFTLGIEINLDKYITVKKFVIIGGALQVGITTVVMTVVSLLFGFNFLQAFFIGFVFTSSSTALIAKIIQERGEESSFIGELALGILMFQDLVFIPMIIIVTSLQTPHQSFISTLSTLFISIIKAAVVLWIIIYPGRRIIPKILNKISRTSRELLDLFIILFIFMICYFSTLLQIPIIISMFMAGILVSQTTEHRHVFSQVKTLRDMLVILFFVYIGSQVHIFSVIGQLPQIALFTVLLVVVKFTILVGIFIYLKFSSRIAFTLGSMLFEASESGFIVLFLGLTAGIIDQSQYEMLVVVILLTLLLTPFMIEKKDKSYRTVRDLIQKYFSAFDLYLKHQVDFNKSPIDEIKKQNHIVICGYGRVGSYIGRALTLAHIPFLAIDYNFHTVEKAKRDGVDIIYGDPADYDILDYAEVEHAKAIIAVIPDKYSQEQIVLHAKKLNPKIIIISRIHDEQYGQMIKDLGAHVVVQPEFEAALSIIKQLYYLHDMSKDEMNRAVKYFKLEHGTE